MLPDAVNIGGKSYICPMKSVAVAKRRLPEKLSGTISSTAISHGPIVTELNDTLFDQYHLFRADTRILTDSGGELH